MKPVLVTQRVDDLPERHERRDALDQQLAAFLAACGYLAIPVQNHPPLARALFALVRPAGVILSGGNDIAALGGAVPERDETEAALVDAAAAAGAPVVGICRGMQFLLHRAGGVLEKLPGHVATRHVLEGREAREVNSFHNFAVTRCGADWEPLATVGASIEYAHSAARRQTAIMWHPEREREFAAADIALFRRALS